MAKPTAYKPRPIDMNGVNQHKRMAMGETVAPAPKKAK